METLLTSWIAFLLSCPCFPDGLEFICQTQYQKDILALLVPLKGLKHWNRFFFSLVVLYTNGLQTFLLHIPISGKFLSAPFQYMCIYSFISYIHALLKIWYFFSFCALPALETAAISYRISVGENKQLGSWSFDLQPAKVYRELFLWIRLLVKIWNSRLWWFMQNGGCMSFFSFPQCS